MNTTSVTAPIKPTTQTSSFRLLTVAVVAAIVLPFLVPIACNLLVSHALFTADDATNVKSFFNNYGGDILMLVAGGGTAGTVGHSLSLTIGKVLAQLSPSIATPETEPDTTRAAGDKP